MSAPRLGRAVNNRELSTGEFASENLGYERNPGGPWHVKKEEGGQWSAVSGPLAEKRLSNKRSRGTVARKKVASGPWSVVR